MSIALGPTACGDDPGSAATETDGVDPTADAGDSGLETDPESDLDQTVPADAAPLELDAFCFELEAQPMQLSMAPEGALWIRLDQERWRVVDPFGNDEIQELPAGVGLLQAWSEDRAFVVDQGVLWDVQAQWPQPLAWPEARSQPTQMCGDPSSDANGFVLSDGLLHRDGGQWWEWSDPEGTPWSEVTWLARNAGTCLGPDGELWLADDDGKVWRVTGDFAARMEPLDGATQAVLVDGLGAAVQLGDDIVAGDWGEFVRYRFDAGPVSTLSSGGESLWVSAGGRIFRWLDGEFRVAMQEGQPVEPGYLQADSAGGVWVVSAEQACHLRPSPPIRVEGVHNLQRLKSATIELGMRAYPGTRVTSATLDGEELPVEPDGPGRWSAAPRDVDEGWHTLEVFSGGPQGSSTRRVRFEQRRVGDLTWGVDVAPLFEEHCSGGACHGPDIDDTTRPDLSTWDSWVDREDAILDRVVVKGDMPPSAVRKDTWGLDLQLLVAEWFESGAAQGDE